MMASVPENTFVKLVMLLLVNVPNKNGNTITYKDNSIPLKIMNKVILIVIVIMIFL
jgi:hypothetical protein